MTVAYLSLGSNLGNREHYLDRAIDLLGETADIKVVAVSSIYETAAWGVTDQPDFLNLCCAVETSLPAHDLLTVCQRIEDQLDRVRGEHWGPRTVDLDILLYDQDILEDEDLVIPHPFLHKRSFVLVPLKEIAAKLHHPVLKQTVSELTEQVKTDDVWLYNPLKNS